jgi:hypothetical protein
MANKAPNYEGVGCDEPYVLVDAACESCDRGLQMDGGDFSKTVTCYLCKGVGHVTEKMPLSELIDISVS